MMNYVNRHLFFGFVFGNIIFIITSSADSPRDSVQFIEWSPTSCPRALLIANFHGRVTIWTQPSQVSVSYQSHYLAPNELQSHFLLM